MLVPLSLCVYVCTYIRIQTHTCTCPSSDVEGLPHLKCRSLLFLVFKMPLPWDHDIIAWHPMNFLQSAFMSSYVRQNYELPSLLISGVKYHLHIGLSCWRQCGWWWVTFSSSPKGRKDNTQSPIMKQAFYRGWFLCDAVLLRVFNSSLSSDIESKVILWLM